MAAIGEHHGWMAEHGELHRRRVARAADEIEAITLATLRARMGDLRGEHSMADLAQQVVSGAIDPYAAADRVLANMS